MDENQAESSKMADIIGSGDLEQAVWLLTQEEAFSQDMLNQTLLFACGRGHKLLVQRLVRAGANIEHRDEQGNTPLLICAENGFTDIVRFLVSRKANVNAVNSAGNTALSLSVSPTGSTDLTRFLLQQNGIDVNRENHFRQTAFVRAIDVMDVDTLLLLSDKVERRHRTNTYRQYFQNIHMMDHGYHEFHNVCVILEEHIDTGESVFELAIQKQDLASFQILLDCQFSSIAVKKQYINDAFWYIFRQFGESRRRTCNTKEITMIQGLLDYGANVSQGYKDRPLRIAVEMGDSRLVALLCRHGALIYEYTFSGREDVLIIAAKDGRQDLIEMILYYGYLADINGPNYAKSPLNCALQNDHTECAKFLLELGAKMDVAGALLAAIDHPTSTYINFLLENYPRDIVEYLSDTSYTGDKMLISILQKGSVELIGRLLNSRGAVSQVSFPEGFPIMTSASEGVVGLPVQERWVNETFLDTPLIQVLSHRQCREPVTVKLVQVMIQCGASVNCQTSDGKTPLMIAASVADCSDMLELLLDNGADVNEKDDEGNNALFHAMVGGYWENLSFLIQTAADKTRVINSQNNEGLSPLMFAVSQGYTLTAIALLSESADVNMTDSRGNTALHHLLMSSSSPSEELLESLIKAGSDVNYQNNDGLTPLMLTAKQSMACAMSSLLTAGAEVNAVSKQEHARTALSYLSDSSYIYMDTLSCLEALLNKDANLCYLSPVFLSRIIIQKLTIVPKLIQHGLVPTDVETDKVPLHFLKTGALPTVSPLCVALLVGHVPLARYFMDINFLTPTDLSMFARNSTLQGLLENKYLVDSGRFLKEICSQPLSLFSLSLVAFRSTLCFISACEDVVNTLHLPPKIQERLLFKSEDCQVALSKLLRVEP